MQGYLVAIERSVSNLLEDQSSSFYSGDGIWEQIHRVVGRKRAFA